MKQEQLRRLAAIGAEKRLVELAEEAAAIYASFPELRDRKPTIITRRGAAKGAEAGSREAAAPVRRGRRRLSPEARKRISDAQKARWAKHRKQAGAR